MRLIINHKQQRTLSDTPPATNILRWTYQASEEIEQNNLLFIALFAIGLAIAKADGEITNAEVSRLGIFINNIRKRGKSSPERDVQIKKLLKNPPNLDEALSYVYKLDNPDYTLFEELIEVIANSDGKFCHREKKFLDDFREKVGRTIVVPVIATMSSGKSTLVNAMLGADILPSANQACTATVLKVENVDGASDWQGRHLSLHDGVSQWQAITSSTLSKWNKEDVLEVEVLGDFPHIHNRDAHLVLYDTPGPNNSMNQSHGEITQDILSGSNYACIICVLNTEQFGIDDELSLLAMIQQQTQLNKTNVIFVLNKFDKLDVESENIIEFIEKVRAHLCNLGFKKPVIIPLMSKLALELRVLISAIEKGEPVPFSSRQQKRIVQELELLDENEEQYFSAVNNNGLNTQIIRPACLLTVSKTNAQKKYTIGDKVYSKQQLTRILTLTGISVLECLLTKNINHHISDKNREEKMLIELTYNPYLVKTAIKVKGKSLKINDDLMRHCQNKRLQSWTDSLLIKITERYRVREIKLTVNCTDLDSEDVEDAVKRFNAGKKDTAINNTFAIKQLFSLRESFLAQESSQEVAQ
jgi:hypothetical protein